MRSPESLRRTKIVATIGPATSQPEVLRSLIEAGATTLRLNFSHGTHEDHHRSIRLIRQVSFELNQPVAILQDLQGPKIRLGKFQGIRKKVVSATIVWRMKFPVALAFC